MYDRVVRRKLYNRLVSYGGEEVLNHPYYDFLADCSAPFDFGDIAADAVANGSGDATL